MQRGTLDVQSQTAYSATPAALLIACVSATRRLEHHPGDVWKASETRGSWIPTTEREGHRGLGYIVGRFTLLLIVLVGRNFVSQL